MNDRVVMITGSNGGLGAAVTKIFLESGARVAGVFHHGPSPTPANTNFLPIQADLRQPQEAARALALVREKAGRLDALVHLVGGFAGGQPVGQTDDATWRSMMDLNLDSAFYTMRAALPLLLEAGHGRIVAVGSRTAVEPVATLSAYGVSKAGLVALVRTIALEARHSGLTANVVLPAVIDTPANRAADPSADHSKWVKPEAIAGVILWLASEGAADVNGAVIPVYGRA